MPQLAQAPRVRSTVWELVGRACQRLPVAADADGTHQRPARCRPRHRTFRERAPLRLVVRRAAILMARVLSRWFQPGILAVGLRGCPCPAAKANPALTPFCRCLDALGHLVGNLSIGTVNAAVRITNMRGETRSTARSTSGRDIRQTGVAFFHHRLQIGVVQATWEIVQLPSVLITGAERRPNRRLPGGHKG